MKLYKLSLALLSIVMMGLFTSCDDDDVKVAKAVLSTASALQFDGINADPQVVTVYSDAPWTADVPEWVTISPETGSGTTDVTISVADNWREGALDNPRKATIVFHGNTVASRCNIIVRQLGDNYRDGVAISVKDINEAEDEAYVIANDVLVAGKFEGGYIVTDDNGANNLFVATDKVAAVGDKLNIKAQKSTDAKGLAVINAEEVTVASSGNVVTYPVPVDITGNLDSYSSATRDYVTVSGVLSGNVLTVNGATNKIAVVNNTEVDIAALSGHIVELAGYYAGNAAPYVNLQVVSTVDNGIARVIYWSEDFEWLEPWSVASGAGNSVISQDLNATAPQIVNASVDGVSVLSALETKGYKFHRVSTKTLGECIYLQRNCLKFGKTSYQAGLSFPAWELPAERKDLFLDFDWCPMKQGSGKLDPVNLVLVIINGTSEERIDIPTHGWANDHVLEWIHATVDLSNYTITKDTEVKLIQTQWPAATANRWFLDNVVLYSTL